MSPLIGDLFKEILKQLSPVSKDLAQRDAEQIMEHVLCISRSELYTNLNHPVNNTQYIYIKKITKRRLTGMPLPYILGFTYFYSKKFIVSQDVLIPRPDTESLIEVVLKNETADICHFLDIGTGSGNIVETLIDTRPKWHAAAIDISETALRIAITNCSERVHLICSNRLSALTKNLFFDFVVCNPPYISADEMKALDSSVTDFEPAVALYGGKDGLDFYRYLADNCMPFLKKNGRAYCEIGVTQDKSVEKIFQDSGWTYISIYNDLANRPRVIKAQKPD